MRFCDFINKLYERFPCSNQGQFVLEIISALCGETDPVNTNRPDDFAFSSCLPVGLSGSDATSRKRLFGNTSRYKGLTKPVKKHILDNAKMETFIAYCEAYVSVEGFPLLCEDFGVSPDVGRALVFEGIYGFFVEFAKSNTDSAPDSFISTFITERLVNPPAETVETKKADAAPAPICAGDDISLIRQVPSSPHKAAFYDKLTHHWVIKNSGVAIWDGRYMEFVNNCRTPLKMETDRVELKKTPPGGEVTITVEVDARHIEGTHEIIMDMKDCEGRLCFPDRRAELRLPVTVGWKK